MLKDVQYAMGKAKSKALLKMFLLAKKIVMDVVVVGGLLSMTPNS